MQRIRNIHTECTLFPQGRSFYWVNAFEMSCSLSVPHQYLPIFWTEDPFDISEKVLYQTTLVVHVSVRFTWWGGVGWGGPNVHTTRGEITLSLPYFLWTLLCLAWIPDVNWIAVTSSWGKSIEVIVHVSIVHMRDWGIGGFSSSHKHQFLKWGISDLL